jgi:diadenosine tetraphosphate (Ap4A) HIT family hydrolase
MTDCILCRGREADAELGRRQTWEDRLWRLTTSVGAGEPAAGFSYLEPKRHIPYITDLEGDEAATLGPVLARVTSALREAVGAELVYLYVFGGGVPHLHLHLAPHREGDPYNDALIRGEVEAVKLASGVTSMVSKDFPALPVEDLEAAARRIEDLLS